MQSILANYLNLCQQTPSLTQQPMTIKQQRSQTIHNFIEFVSDFYEDFQPKANML